MQKIISKSRIKKLFAGIKNYSSQLIRRKTNIDKRLLLPTIIFQPGKVGSSSVKASLLNTQKELGISVPVHHTHNLERLDEIIEYVSTDRAAPQASIRLLTESKVLREEIRNHPEQTWNVISLVREPVALKVSALFQLLRENIPDWKSRLENGNLSMEDLEDMLYNKKGFSASTGLDRWYDNQIKSLWGLDVFEQPFSIEKGYQIYHPENINLIILRLEDLNRVAERAFYEFLGIKGFKIISVNIGEEKPYAGLYKQFKQRALRAEYVDAIYQTRFARHFYTATEIEQFRQKWINPPALLKRKTSHLTVCFNHALVEQAAFSTCPFVRCQSAPESKQN